MNNCHTTVIYQGGSGGFFLYYYLLLSGHYTVDTALAWQWIDQQFGDQLQHHPEQWKAAEQWPNNPALKLQRRPQLLMVCNPTFSNIDHNLDIVQGTHKILLWTSLRLQLKMSWYKRAYWFTDVSRQKFLAPTNDQSYIRQILNSGTEFCNTVVDPEVPKIIDLFQPSMLVRLEDLIQEKSPLGLPTQDQRAWCQRWLSLQPRSAQRLLTG